MDTSMLRTPLIAQTVEALVADGGGLITYEQGMGGRETLVAAAAVLAARNRSPLTIVESAILQEETRAAVAELQPAVQCTVISAQDAALQPPPVPGSVLAVHADMLRDPTVREPLLELARAADHLLVARHDYSDPTLDSLAGATHRLDYAAFTAAANKDFTVWAEPFAPTYVPPPIEQRDGRKGQPQATRSASPLTPERKQRLDKQMNQRPDNGPSREGVEYLDVAYLEALAHADIDVDRIATEVQEREGVFLYAAEQRAAEIRDRLQEAARDRAAGSPRPPAPSQHGQAQSAARQHHTHGGRAPG